VAIGSSQSTALRWHPEIFVQGNLGVAPTGKQIEGRCFDLFHMCNGKLIALW